MQTYDPSAYFTHHQGKGFAVRVRAAIGAVVASGSILLVGWNVGQQSLANTLSSALPARPAPAPSAAAKPSATPSPVPTAMPTTVATPTAAPAPATPVPAAPAPAAPAAGATDGTFTGSLTNTPYGTVQVSVTIAGGKITDVAALKLTDRGSQSASISRQVAPILKGEVLAAQSANVSNVSGGTYTTEGYLISLQSALDQAHFAG